MRNNEEHSLGCNKEDESALDSHILNNILSFLDIWAVTKSECLGYIVCIVKLCKIEKV